MKKMKRFFSTILIAVLAAFAFSSCETMDPNKDFSGTIYGFWVVDKLEVEAAVTIDGDPHSIVTTTNFDKDYCRLNLDPSGLATLWYNLDMDIERFQYNDDTKKIEFKESTNAGDNGKAIVLLGIDDVELDEDQMIFRQPKASIGTDAYNASESATYYFHRAPVSEKPKDTSN